MKNCILLIAFFVICFVELRAQNDTSFLCPNVNVSLKLTKHPIKFGDNFYVIIVLTNKTHSVQNAWFDRPKFGTGGPALTSIMLTNRKTGVSILKYQNKAILMSQAYSIEQVNKYSYYLKPGQKVSGRFSLTDLVVLLDDKQFLDRGDYEMQVFYCNNPSNKICFTVE